MVLVLSDRINRIQTSQTIQIAVITRDLIAKGKKIISLNQGEPDFETPKKIVNASHSAIKKGFTKYSNPFGDQKLREKISNKLNKENRLSTTANEIIITPGAKMALSLSLSSILKINDEVINFLPSYPSYQNQILSSF